MRLLMWWLENPKTQTKNQDFTLFSLLKQKFHPYLGEAYGNQYQTLSAVRFFLGNVKFVPDFKLDYCSIQLIP